MTNIPSSQAHEAVAADTFRRSRGRWRLVAFVAAVLAVLAFFGRFALPGGEGSEVVARVTFELNLKLMPCLLSERCRV